MNLKKLVEENIARLKAEMEKLEKEIEESEGVKKKKLEEKLREVKARYLSEVARAEKEIRIKEK
ncbi:MAG: hypothetical protein ACE5QV_00105 [Fidelibacterota bacterium]